MEQGSEIMGKRKICVLGWTGSWIAHITWCSSLVLFFFFFWWRFNMEQILQKLSYEEFDNQQVKNRVFPRSLESLAAQKVSTYIRSNAFVNEKDSNSTCWSHYNMNEDCFQRPERLPTPPAWSHYINWMSYQARLPRRRWRDLKNSCSLLWLMQSS